MINKPKPVTGIQQNEFAKLLGVTPPRIIDYINNGMPIGENGLVPFEDAVEWLAENVRNSEARVRRARASWEKSGSTMSRTSSQGARGPKKDITFSEAHRRREVYGAQLKKLEVMEALGKVVRHEDVMTAAFDTYRAVRDQLMTIPDRVSAEFAVEDDPKKIATRLKGELKLALGKVTLGRKKVERERAA